MYSYPNKILSAERFFVLAPVMLLFTFCCIHASAQSYVPAYKDQRIKVAPVVPVKAYYFNLNEVRLLNSPFKAAMLKDSAYLLTIDPDRLLSGFRSHSGLKPKGQEYGGWESSGLAGHTLGHYLSAISMEYASGGGPEFLKRVNYIVGQLRECQLARKTGYIGAIPKEDSIWSAVKAGNIKTGGFDLNGGWSPWYTVHKVMAGLLDAYLYCGNREAPTVCEGIGDWTGETIKNLNDGQIQKMLICEYGGMAEALANLYAITGDKKYLALSYKFYDKRILDPLSQGKDILAGKHSNTNIPKIIASARRYELTDDERDKAIADFFWKVMTKDNSYANGGNGNYEYLSEPDKLNDKLTDNTIETCATYNMLKLTRHLFEVNPSAGLMDYYENALYNDILASQNHDDGMVCYFVSLRMGGKKDYSTPFDDFTCCVGTGMENHVKYQESIYAHNNAGDLFVNLFIPSVLNWKEKGIRLVQQTGLPVNNVVGLTLHMQKAVSFDLLLRKPQWANTYQVKLNGITLKTGVDTDGYINIKHKWKNNDHIELVLNESVYAKAMPDNPDRRALFYGPVLLAGELGVNEPDPVQGIPVLVSNDTDPAKWLRMVNKNQLEFVTAGLGRPADVKLIPFNETKNEHYSVYWDFFTPETWAIRQKIYDEERKHEKEIEAHTTDLFRLGEMQPERDHNFTGQNQTIGEDHQRKWRSTDDGGFLSFEMKTDPSAQNTLINTYWGMDNRGRIFDVYIDGVKLTTVDLEKYKENKFYNVSYELPIELTKGKSKVTVKFVAKKGFSAGPVYGIRMVRD